MTALEILNAHERELVADLNAATGRAVEYVDGGQRVPVALLDEIAQIEVRIGSLVTLKMTIEPRS